MAHWTDGREARIFYVTPGYRLIALNAKTGTPVAGFGKDGIVDLKQDEDPAKELKFNAVFRYANGKLTVEIKDLNRPNGIALSPDEKTIYVANSDEKRRIWIALRCRSRRQSFERKAFRRRNSRTGSRTAGRLQDRFERKHLDQRSRAEPVLGHQRSELKLDWSTGLARSIWIFYGMARQEPGRQWRTTLLPKLIEPIRPILIFGTVTLPTVTT